MKAIVKLHVDCKVDMAEWMEGTPGQETYRSLFLDVYIENIAQCLRDSNGNEGKLLELGAIRSLNIVPPHYTWSYSDDLVVQFAVRYVNRPLRTITRWLPSWFRKHVVHGECEIIVLRLVS